MKVGRAILAGLVGGFVMTVLAWVVRQLGIDMNAEMMLGTMLVAPPSGTAWLIGFALHMMLSALIALAYAWGFEQLAHRSGVGIGLAFAVVHVIIAGVVMGMIPAMHPMIPGQMPPPGAFLANMGGTFVALFVVEHLLYGAVVGGMYGPVEHPRSDALRARPTTP
jgi:hypothetical protein